MGTGFKALAREFLPPILLERLRAFRTVRPEKAADLLPAQKSPEEIDLRVLGEIERMGQRLLESSDPSLNGPAAFWKDLADKHQKMIKLHGFRNFKRTINFEYHQWPVRDLADAKIWKLLRRLVDCGCVADGLKSTTLNPASVEGLPIEPRSYAIFMGLLWQFAVQADTLKCLDCCREPLFGNPIPVFYKDELVSQDLATSVLELNRIAETVDLCKAQQVLEIGAGYGRLAYVIARRFPMLKYHIVDIPPALAVCKNYLTEVLGNDNNVSYYLPPEMGNILDRSLDLVINISSFDEMSQEQVLTYFEFIDQKCKGWFYIKGHRDAPDWCPNSGGGVSQLPYPRRWHVVHEGEDAFSPSFIERIYKIGD